MCESPPLIFDARNYSTGNSEYNEQTKSKEILMTEKKPSEIIVTQQGGVVRNILNQLKLILRLMGDPRVNIFAKLIPIGTLVYLISPIDAVSLPIIGAVDDAALLWLGSYVFTELCPPEVVAEHMKALAANTKPGGSQDDVIDGETTEVKE
ncbi:MAG: hypothetical protein DPW18_10375 [Chloroflexi bacterium]|nr:hypothetical protein [Chloroflexota bacterium]MDL1943895.1 DUF1232 domain-containing protein [Chloroflexi bacterium CFX2]